MKDEIQSKYRVQEEGKACRKELWKDRSRGEDMPATMVMKGKKRVRAYTTCT